MYIRFHLPNYTETSELNLKLSGNRSVGKYRPTDSHGPLKDSFIHVVSKLILSCADREGIYHEYGEWPGMTLKCYWQPFLTPVLVLIM